MVSSGLDEDVPRYIVYNYRCRLQAYKLLEFIIDMDEEEIIEPIPAHKGNNVAGSQQIRFQSDLHTEDTRGTNRRSLTEMRKEVKKDVRTYGHLRPVRRNRLQ